MNKIILMVCFQLLLGTTLYAQKITFKIGLKETNQKGIYDLIIKLKNNHNNPELIVIDTTKVRPSYFIPLDINAINDHAFALGAVITWMKKDSIIEPEQRNISVKNINIDDFNINYKKYKKQVKEIHKINEEFDSEFYRNIKIKNKSKEWSYIHWYVNKNTIILEPKETIEFKIKLNPMNFCEYPIYNSKDYFYLITGEVYKIRLRANYPTSALKEYFSKEQINEFNKKNINICSDWLESNEIEFIYNR